MYKYLVSMPYELKAKLDDLARTDKRSRNKEIAMLIEQEHARRRGSHHDTDEFYPDEPAEEVSP